MIGRVIADHKEMFQFAEEQWDWYRKLIDAPLRQAEAVLAPYRPMIDGMRRRMALYYPTVDVAGK